MSVELDIYKTKSFLRVRMTGRLVAANANSLLTQLDAADVFSNYRIVFDLTNMSHIDSSGLGIMVKILQKAKESGSSLYIAGLQPHPKIVFEITKMERIFNIFDTMEEAEESLEKKLV